MPLLSFPFHRQGRLRPSAKQPSASKQRPGWCPLALRWWNLSIATLLCWAFIAVLQYFLSKSQRDGGILFAADVNDLPLRRSFAYLYLPTIVAVVFSIFIVWVDNDAKRFEPYRQLSKADGALGKDSLLLHYPFEFMPVVPFVAARRGHWMVFWASLATMLINFGVVPLQAGIFSTRQITRTSSQPFVVSEAFIHSSSQEADLTLAYAQSAYGVLELNETLPAFTAPKYTLKPFASSSHTKAVKGTLSAKTTMYSMDLNCEEGAPVTQVFRSEPSITGFNSSSGCLIEANQSNNNTIGAITVDYKSLIRNKRYSAFYSGYFRLIDPNWSDDAVRLAQSLEAECRGQGYKAPSVSNRTFFATLTENRATEQSPLTNVTAMFCRCAYYEQDVDATVDALTNAPTRVVPFGDRRELPGALFNYSFFEESVAAGSRLLQARTNNLPVDVFPRYLDRLFQTELTPSLMALGEGQLPNPDLPPILTMALSTSKYPLHDLLDPRALSEAYRQAYQLLFSLAMSEVLKTDFSSKTSKIEGIRLEQQEAVILEPIFTYLVEALLGVVSLAILALLYFGTLRNARGGLNDDPGSIAAAMSMTADSRELLATFEDLDCCSTQHLRQKLSGRRYKISNDDAQCRLVPWTASPVEKSLLGAPEPHQTDRLAKALRPTEFRALFAIPFTGLFIALVITLAVLFAKSRLHGLPLPSNNKIVQNLVSEYLPTAVATLIEPIWILINRLLCLLQPLEEMRGSKASPKRSIAINYNSLPPQLTIFKAARAGHTVLAAVCAMALLSNLLATAFAGLFFQEVLPIPRDALFSPPYQARFTHINGSSGPPYNQVPTSSEAEYSGAYQGGTGEDYFLIAESNYTRNTSLPSWTDGKAMYLPFRTSSPTEKEGRMYQARTKYFSANPNCKPMVFGDDYYLQIWNTEIVGDSMYYDLRPTDVVFDMQVPDADGYPTKCYSSPRLGLTFANRLGAPSRTISSSHCRSGQVAAELTTPLMATVNASSYDHDTCHSAVAVGWMRKTQPACRRYIVGTDPEQEPGFEDASASNTFFLMCQPQMEIGDATVTVDAAGVLQGQAFDRVPDPDQTPAALDKYFSNGAANLIAQSNLFLFRSLNSPMHNDSFAGEFIHYFMTRSAGSLHLTSPSAPLPTFSDVENPMNTAYARLFAIWLSVNQDLLFLRADSSISQISGSTLTPEQRLRFVTPLFILAQSILAIYVLVAILVYVRRPGRYLARLPTSLAAVVALFASSAAVEDLKHTSHLSNRRRAEYLDALDVKYGYGSFVGGDGRVHVGVEKVPFVRVLDIVGFEGCRGGTEGESASEKKKAERVLVAETEVQAQTDSDREPDVDTGREVHTDTGRERERDGEVDTDTDTDTDRDRQAEQQGGYVHIPLCDAEESQAPAR